MWQAQAGEAGVDTDFRLLCWGHGVWLLFTTDRLSNGTPSGGSDHVWVVASDQQGIANTWTQIHVSNGQEVALSTGDQGDDVDEPEGAAKSGSLHVIFEYDYGFAAGVGAASLEEDVFYQRVDFVAQAACDTDDAHGHMSFIRAAIGAKNARVQSRKSRRQ